MVFEPNPFLSGRVQTRVAKGVHDVNRIAKELTQSGIRVVRLIQGEPDFDTPPVIAAVTPAQGERTPDLTPEISARVADQLRLFGNWTYANYRFDEYRVQRVVNNVAVVDTPPGHERLLAKVHVGPFLSPHIWALTDAGVKW